jgi:protein-S-isoprenylcysteine O-methyltransferase Ste14
VAILTRRSLIRRSLMLRSSLILGVQLVPCILLMLLGWGFDDWRGFLGNPARAGLVALIFAGALAVVAFGLDFDPVRRGSKPVGSQSLQLGILLGLSLFLVWFLPFADRRGVLTFTQSYWRYLGLSLCGSGVGVRILALRALGGQFSAYVTLQPNHRLVREGIYSRIRHPLYLSLLLAPFGIALVFASYLALPILVLALIFVFDRVRKEERLLAAHFGQEFEDYQRCTRRLV